MDLLLMVRSRVQDADDRPVESVQVDNAIKLKSWKWGSKQFDGGHDVKTNVGNNVKQRRQ